MERLTERDDQGMVALVCREGCRGGPACFECEQRAARCLAAYEDTGLEPEAVVQLKGIAEIFNYDLADPAQLKGLCVKLRELAQAERDGRLVVLPGKVGDTVYRVFHPEGRTPVIVEQKIETILDAANLVNKMGERTFVDTYSTRQEAEAAVERMKNTAPGGAAV